MSNKIKNYIMELIKPNFRLKETPETIAFIRTHKGEFSPIGINVPLEDAKADKSVLVVKWDDINTVLENGKITFKGRKYKTDGGFQRSFIMEFYINY